MPNKPVNTRDRTPQRRRHHFPVFHVEHGRVEPGARPEHRQLGRGHQHLNAGSALQVGQHPLLVRVVQFRRQIVKSQHRPVPPLPGKVRRLRQQHRQGRELGLATRKRLATGQARERKPPVGAMGPDPGMPARPIAVARQQQGIGQGHLTATPARLELQRLDGQRPGQLPGRRQHLRLQSPEIAFAIGGDRLASVGQFMVPCIQLRVAASRFEECVALPQGSRVTAPWQEEGLFHVEQPPIHESPAVLATARNQGMAPGFERHHRQRGAQLAQLGDILAIQTPCPAVAGVAKARLAYPPPAGAIVLRPLDEHL